MKNCSHRFGVLILAAGASRRMGRPKALLPWGRGTVLEHHLRLWEGGGAFQVAVVIDPANVPLLEELQRLNWVDVILNEHPEEGMMSSLRVASAWPNWQGDLVQVVVVLVDQPQFPLGAIQRLMTMAAVNTGPICQPQHEGRRGHPVVLPYPAFLGLASTPAATLRDYLNESGMPRKALDLECGWWLDDMNVPGAYERLRQLSEGDAPDVV